MFELFDFNNRNFMKFDDIDLYNIYIRYMAIPINKNAKTVFDDFEVEFGIDSKIPIFVISSNEAILSTGIIIVNDYIKNKLINKLYNEFYTKDIIDVYKRLPVNTVAYTNNSNIDTKDMILTFLITLENIEL